MTIRKFALTALGAALVLGTTAPMSMAAPRDGAGKNGLPMRPELAYVYLLKTADTNKDGKIAKEEFAARQDAMFTQIDADKDGTVTPKEMRVFRKAKMDEFRAANPRPEREKMEGSEGKKGGPEHAERDGKGHEGSRHEAREGGKRPGGRMNAMFAMADSDGNGQISKAEYGAAGEKMFARLDKNTDSVISIDDMPNRPFM